MCTAPARGAAHAAAPDPGALHIGQRGTCPPALVLAAHGTRDPHGPGVLEELVRRVRSRLPGVPVRLGYVDVVGPRLDSVLPSGAPVPDGGTVLVPLFLGTGHHVRADVPAAVRALQATGRRAVVTPALGPAREVVHAVADRLLEAGHLPDAVVLAAAGSSDPGALEETWEAAARLAARLDRPVSVGYLSAARPGVAEALRDLRADHHGRVGVASYLLAPGLFQRRLAASGADVVGGPIGAHPALVDLVVARYRRGLAGLAA